MARLITVDRPCHVRLVVGQIIVDCGRSSNEQALCLENLQFTNKCKNKWTDEHNMFAILLTNLNIETYL